MFLTKDQILAIEDCKTEPMDIPEWGGKVMVRGCNALEHDEYEQSMVITTVVDDATVTKTDFKNAKARLVVKCVLTEKGERLFSDEDATALGFKCAGVVSRLFHKIEALSGIRRGPGVKPPEKDITKN